MFTVYTKQESSNKSDAQIFSIFSCRHILHIFKKFYWETLHLDKQIFALSSLTQTGQSVIFSFFLQKKCSDQLYVSYTYVLNSPPPLADKFWIWIVLMQYRAS